MKLSLKHALIPAIVALVVAPAAHAEDDWVVKWSNGHKMESEDGQFELKFGGRIQADYTFVSPDTELEGGYKGDGFEFRRARLFFEGTIYQRVSFKAQYDFTNGESAFKDVWIGLDNSWGQVRMGHFKEPFSLEIMTSSKYIAFVERSMPIEAFAPERNSGVGVLGKKGDKFNWGLGYFYEADDFGVSEDENRTNLTGRVAYRPIYEDKGKRMLHLGLAFTTKNTEDGGTQRFRSRPEAHFANRLVDTGSFASNGADILGLELAGVFNRFWFAAESINASVDAPAVGDPTFSGYYAQVGYFLTDDYRRFKSSEGGFDRQKPKSTWGKDGGSGAWEVLARFSTLDLTDKGITGGEEDNLTLGVNWYPNPATRFMLNWVRADVKDVGNSDAILARWQVDF